MPSRGAIWIQPHELLPGVIKANRWTRGIPSPGITGLVQAVTGAATCANLLALAPPSLLERYALISFAIGWGAYATNFAPFSAPPAFTVELALLVSNRPAYAATQTQTGLQAGNADAYTVAGVFTSDLVNPIYVSTSETLALRIGIQFNEDVTAGSGVFVGAQYELNQAGTGQTPLPFESSIAYEVDSL